ncbi:DUF2497 domain-containing protein [Wolbachia endosymbiont of Litomosoides sigmodontis]|nr:DUF2497 domain-containing protein [Wolbachia endosymbiont of Litomosoides sigmodontis]
MQNELQHKQQKKFNFTVEGLVTSLLKPQLSEWLKEFKDIINNK